MRASRILGLMPVSNPMAETQQEPWRKRLDHLLARRRFADATKLLDAVIQDTLPLFQDRPEIAHVRRLAWLVRIDLLRERGRYAEALAWLCLECELHPDNVHAQVLKERLKRQLRFAIERREPGRLQADDQWEGVAGMRELKAMLERDVLLPLQEPELYAQYKVDMPNGILLYGPPGCGKTFIARALAKRVKYNFMEIKPSELASIYIHGTQQKVGELFTAAAKQAPTMLFLDEIDALVPDRASGQLYHSYAQEVNEFLVQLSEASKKRVLVVGATNVLEKIDKAILRPGRMDKKIYVGPPDMEARAEALRVHMKERPQAPIDWLGVAAATENCSFAEIEHCVNEAARAALADRRLIATEDLLRASRENRPQDKSGYGAPE